MIGSDGHVYRDKPTPEPSKEFLEAYDNLVASGTGWPEQGSGEGYNQNAHTKLTQEQLDYIYDSGEPISQWIRDAVQERIDTENHYKRANERHHGDTA